MQEAPHVTSKKPPSFLGIKPESARRLLARHGVKRDYLRF